MTTFADAIAAFQTVTAQEAQARIASGDKFTLFIGRSTCPYCQRFAPKLSQVAKTYGLPVAFLNSEDFSDFDHIQALRDQYGVRTVPGLLVAEAGKVKVVCDSSLSEAAIKDFIG